MYDNNNLPMDQGPQDWTVPYDMTLDNASDTRRACHHNNKALMDRSLRVFSERALLAKGYGLLRLNKRFDDTE